MTVQARNIAILGSTGSIGRSALEVIQAIPDRLNVVALSAHTSLSRLAQQIQQHQPRWAVVTDPHASESFQWPELPGCELQCGSDQLEAIVASDQVDTVLAAIVGSAGLRSTWAALEAGKVVALANKETLVVAGPLCMELAGRSGATLLPVDSEHSAVFQASQSGRRNEIKRVILTASGGPFLRYSQQQLKQVTCQQALAHPTWDMGPKITVDSATMMNKALEVIEARWLFDLDPGQIDVMVHPQSVVHSMVEFIDGSVLAQMSPPDMKLPIQYALTYPDRIAGPAQCMDWSKSFQLDFEPPDLDRFPALSLGNQVAKAGGTTGAVLNAANEAAVASFLEGQLAFHEIVPACQAVLEHHEFDASPSLEQLIELDRWARQEITKWICA